jgi:hypothetical protein
VSPMSALPCPVERLFEQADEAYEKIKHSLLSEGPQMSLSDLEGKLMSEGFEVMRRLLQERVNLFHPGESTEPVRDAEGELRTSSSVEHTRSVETIFGTIELTRAGYPSVGKESLHPLDATLNLPPEKYSLQVRRVAALEAAKGSFEEGVEAIATYTGARIAKRQFEELATRAAVDFEAFYADRQKSASRDADTGSILVLTMDGKGVSMLPEDLREATRKAAAEKSETFTARLGQGRRMNAKRMASVAAIYSVNPFVRTPEQILPENKPQEVAVRPRPEHKRVWASLADSPEQVIAAMFEEALHRDPNREKQWVALVDGNKTQIAHLEKLNKTHDLSMPIVVDFIHVAEYVWEAAKALLPDDKPQQDRWVRKHMLELLRGKTSSVAAGIRRSATFGKLPDAQRKPVDACADYLLNYKPYLQYEEALKRGAPIATGVIEGACGYLVESRMNRSGARWSLTGAEAVLRLRALRTSGDFDAYWKFHESQEYQRNHAANYADHCVPDLVPPRVFSPKSKPRGGLKIVK